MDQYRKARMQKLQDFIGKSGLDAMLVTSQDAIFYLSGASYTPVERPFFIIVKPEGSPELVVPRLEYEHMLKVEGFGNIQHYFEYPSIPGQNWYDYIAKSVGEDKVIGIEPSLPSAYRELIKAKETRIIDFIDNMRLVKDAGELEAIRLAAKWTDEGMRLVHKGLYRGESVLEPITSARTIQTGVIKTTDYNYMTCRFLGEPSERDRKLYDVVMKARDIAYSMVKPGTRCGDIDLATQDYFKSLGYGDAILHRTGHGIGLGNHEAPWLSAGGNHVLKENMVISIEPALYFDDIGGFRHSDTVLVTKNGFERLTKYPDDLESLIVRDKRTINKIKGFAVRKAVNLDRF